MGRKKKYEIKFFKEWAEEKGGFCLSDEYVDYKTKISLECECGYKWQTTPRVILNGSWCPECAINNNRKYQLNQDLFSEVNEISMYLAGFWAADGWVCHGSSGGYTVGLSLSTKDLDHLNTIKSYFCNDIPTRFSTNRSPRNYDKICYHGVFTTNCKKIFQDLAKFNVVERKTYIYKMPDWLVNHPLVHHFMRGYIDGDGCFYKYSTFTKRNNDERTVVVFCMRGTSEVLNQFADIFHNKAGLHKKDKLEPLFGFKYPAFNKLKYSGNYCTNKIYEFLYKDATIFLERKRGIAKLAGEHVIKGTDRKRQYSGYYDPDEVLSLYRELKCGKRVAEVLGCTDANISWFIKRFGLNDEVKKIVEDNKKETQRKIFIEYCKLRSYADVAKKSGNDINLTKSNVRYNVLQFQSKYPDEAIELEEKYKETNKNLKLKVFEAYCKSGSLRKTAKELNLNIERATKYVKEMENNI